MRRAFILTLLILSLALIAAAETVKLTDSIQPFEAQVVSQTPGQTVLSFRVNSYDKIDISIDGNPAVLLQKLRKESVIEEKGCPRLPRIIRSIVIPDNGIMDYEIVYSSYIDIENIDIAPSKGHFPRTIEPESVPYTYGQVYQKDEFYPQELVELGSPYILRDFRGMAVKVNAFQYNPVRKVLRIYTDVTLKVIKKSSGGENVLQRRTPLTKMDPQFAKVYKRHFVNFNQTDYPVLLESGGMLIICYDSFMGEMELFVQWKKQKGIPTDIVAVSSVGTTSTAVKNYIRNYYNSHDLGYVLLVGDAAQVATPSGGDSDPQYTQLVGNDSYSEIFVGRFSAQTEQQVVTQVERTITYEKFPDPQGTWYARGLGDADESGPCNPEATDADHITIIANKLVRWNYDEVDSVYTTFGGTTNMIMNYMNQGCTIFNYAGHGWVNGVGPVNFTSANANALTNDNKLFHMVAVACEPGNFATNTCLAEDLLRAYNHSTGEPTGAIAVYLSEISQSWFPPYDMQDEGVDLICDEEMVTFGGMCYNGGMLMIDLFGTQGINEFDAWTLFGDPSVCIRSKQPYNLTVMHNPQLPAGIGSFDVTVSDALGPVEGASVCGMNTQSYASGITDSQGHVTLLFDITPTQPGSFTLTVTTNNAIPYITEVPIIPVNGPYIVLDGYDVQDDITGNNNGQLDFGETIQLAISLSNIGNASSGNVLGTLSSTDPEVHIIQGSASFGQILPDSLSTVFRAFELSISQQISEFHLTNFVLNLTDGTNNWQCPFIITAHAPDVQFVSLTINDQSGNNNGNLNTGEGANLSVEVINNGTSPAAVMQGQLLCADPYINIINSQCALGALPVGGTAEALFTVMVSTACPQNHEIEFQVVGFTAGGFSDTTSFTTIANDPLYLPVGPDVYGYYAYDNYDLPQQVLYNWIEISADSGGLGTQVPFTQDDQVLTFPLPFTFQYYGQEYDTLTISSNGYIAMGRITADDYSNTGIPNSDGPAAMIASYWEDLSPQRTNSGKVWQRYDAVEHLYIIEFNHVEQFAPTGNFETFETILYDPDFYTTSTGDGKIKMQYKSPSASVQTEGTIGIENPAETTGIQYLFDGAYNPSAASITAGRAILYAISDVVPGINVTLSPQNPPIVIPPAGGSFQYSVNIVNSQTPLTFDVWTEAVLPNSSIYGPILLRQNITLPAGGQLGRTLTQNVPASAPSGTYTYRCKAGEYPTTVYDMDDFTFSKSGVDNSGTLGNWNISGWGEDQIVDIIIPDKYYLSQNTPNPFNPVTEILFGLSENTRVEVKIFDILGRETAVLYAGFMPAGEHRLTFDGTSLSSGVYFYSLKTEHFTSVKKMILVK